jgi:predicted ester cyclase
MSTTETTSSITETAKLFFDACESGAGWGECRMYCHDDATFSAQTKALSGIETLEAYTEWMKAMYMPLPDAGYELRSFAVDSTRQDVVAYAVFRATHTGEGGPVPATGQKVEADYVYVMSFHDGRIRHMTKIWNDVISLEQLGWA